MTNQSIEWKQCRSKVPELFNLTAVGLLAGLSFGVQFGLVPVLNQFDAAHYIDTMQRIIPTYTHAVIPLMGMGFGTFMVRLFWLPSISRISRFWTLAGFVFFVMGAWITIRGHWPLNHQLIEWQPQSPPEGWETLRHRWGQLNFWRLAVAEFGFLSVMLSSMSWKPSLDEVPKRSLQMS